MIISPLEIAAIIDHSVLKPNNSQADIIIACEVVLKYKVASLCIRPCDVKLAFSILNNNIPLCTVIGFPNGNNTLNTKVIETTEALEMGCTEIDFVVNINNVKSNNWDDVNTELNTLVTLINTATAKSKIIFENCYLTPDEIIKLTQICNTIKPTWIKTSTGFGTYGARPEDVKLMKEFKDDAIQIKASGGIRSLEQLLQFKNMGCSRIGTSATEEILKALINE